MEGQLSSMETTGEKLMVETMGIGQELKALVQVVGMLARNLDKTSKASQGSINVHERGKKGSSGEVLKKDRSDLNQIG